MSLNAGGGPAQLVRNVGSPNSVQGFLATGPISGPRLASALSAVVKMLGADGAAQISAAAAAAVTVWLKVGGLWKQTTPFIKVSGTWKQATPNIKVAGIWK